MARAGNRWAGGMVRRLMSPPDVLTARPLLFLAGALVGLLAVQFSANVMAEQVEPEEPPTVLGTYDLSGTVIGAYPPPQGAKPYRTQGFGAWVQALELEPPSVPVTTYKGRVVPGDFHVVKLPLVPGDLQQCADTAIRLRAEWLLEQGQEEAIMFHATSGDPMPWSRYRDGERAFEVDNRLEWGPAPPQSWDQYLSAVFMWAGTRSLRYDTKAAEFPAAGDVMVLPGSPGHAVIILGVANASGRIFILAGQGYMPAQSFHIVRGPHAGWWEWDSEDGAEVGPWDFPADSLRTWRAP